MSKPEIPQGYLGAQPKWSEYGLSTVTHNSPEIKVNDTKLEIKIKTSKPTKVRRFYVSRSAGPFCLE